MWFDADFHGAAQIMKAVAIVNPNSSHGKTRAQWGAVEGRLREAFGTLETRATTGPMTAPGIVRAALRDGADLILAVGGDGTINEVVNGFFENDAAVKPDARLALFTSGTGGDFRRTFGLPVEVDAQVERLARLETRTIDIGKLTLTTDEGREAVRYFDNIASFGLSGLADRSVNSLTWGKMFGGNFAFQWGTLKAMLRYRNQPVRIRVDDGEPRTFRVNTAAVCNGRYFGSGMMMGPGAEPDDGLFDVVIVADTTLGESLRDAKKLYTGEHVNSPKCTVLRGKKVYAEPVDEAASGPVLLDVDGETPGKLPATFEIMPGALRLVC
jgi:diacylglycerol kinase (ATP)